MKKVCLTAAIAATILSVSARAHDGNTGSCQVEDFAWRVQSGFLIIDGVTTCASGLITLRLYSGADVFLAVDTAIINGHAFKSMSNGINVPGDTLKIKYSVTRH